MLENLLVQIIDMPYISHKELPQSRAGQLACTKNFINKINIKTTLMASSGFKYT